MQVSPDLRVRIRLIAAASAIPTNAATIVCALDGLRRDASCLSIDMAAAATALLSLPSPDRSLLSSLFTSVAALGPNIALSDRAALIASALQLARSVLAANASAVDLANFFTNSAPKRLAFIEAELVGHAPAVIQRVALQYFSLALQAVEHGAQQAD